MTDLELTKTEIDKLIEAANTVPVLRWDPDICTAVAKLSIARRRFDD